MSKEVWVKVAVVEQEGHVWVKVEMDGTCIRGDAENARQLAQDLLTAAADLEHRHARRLALVMTSWPEDSEEST
jgi:uncharacterized protein GlcG (DUF336 family)